MSRRPDGPAVSWTGVVLAGGRSHESEQRPAVPWMHAPDGAGLADQLAEHGLLRPCGAAVTLAVSRYRGAHGTLRRRLRR